MKSNDEKINIDSSPGEQSNNYECKFNYTFTKVNKNPLACCLTRNNNAQNPNDCEEFYRLIKLICKANLSFINNDDFF